MKLVLTRVKFCKKNLIHNLNSQKFSSVSEIYYEQFDPFDSLFAKVWRCKPNCSETFRNANL